MVQTQIDVKEAPNGASSVLTINTPDRPGLLVDIVRVLKDINLNVVSAEVDTVGKQVGAGQDRMGRKWGRPAGPYYVALSHLHVWSGTGLQAAAL